MAHRRLWEIALDWWVLTKGLSLISENVKRDFQFGIIQNETNLFDDFMQLLYANLFMTTDVVWKFLIAYNRFCWKKKEIISFKITWNSDYSKSNNPNNPVNQIKSKSEWVQISL